MHRSEQLGAGACAGGEALRRSPVATVALALALAGAAAQTARAEAGAAPPSDAAPIATAPPAEVVVNGVPFKETVLPTRLRSDSTYGLDLNVMDTPRNTTLLSTTQLQTLNIEDPRAFSYLTSSSYSDSSFGTPNIPRIRGQYADVFVNGMRSSFTQNGYGAPPNFDDLANISITKGPASVVDGPGPGVGGEVDFLTKRPNLGRQTSFVSLSSDTIGNNRAVVDFGAPLIRDELGVLFSYSGEDSRNTYFYGHWIRKNALYTAIRWQPNSRYRLDVNQEVNVEQYTENVGVNRVNQNLISHGLYLQGAPSGEYFSSLIGSPPIPVGSPGDPYSPVPPILTQVTLTGAAPLNYKTTIDETPGTSSRANLYNLQAIQTYELATGVSLENNTFFNYQNSANQEAYYYADTSRGSWTLENRTLLRAAYDLPSVFGLAGLRNEVAVGFTYRYAHVNYISDFSAETVSVYDLTSNPRLWTYSAAYQLLYADAYPYRTPYGTTFLGTPGRDETNNGNTGVSDLQDGAIFVEDRLQLTPALSLLFGGRIDAVQDHTYDPLGGAACCGSGLPQSHATGVYGLGNGNVSLTYRPRPWVSAYLTFDATQSVNENGGEGGVNAYGQVSDATLLRSDSFLYEAGLKFNLLSNKLFVGTAVFDQKRSIPVGFGGTAFDRANIRGFEGELNYQPMRSFFLTASYSFIKTTLNTAPPFYDYPAEPGVNVDGSALFATFLPGQKFNNPGVPQHVFNALANYKFPNGLGVRGGVQVTGPIQTTPSGRLDLDASSLGGLFPLPADIVASGGVYRAPVIPWQYTANAAVFYEWSHYVLTLSVYNLSNQRNWQPSPNLYGDDFLVLNDPRTFEARLQAKF